MQLVEKVRHLLDFPKSVFLLRGMGYLLFQNVFSSVCITSLFEIPMVFSTISSKDSENFIFTIFTCIHYFK